MTLKPKYAIDVALEFNPYLIKPGFNVLEKHWGNRIIGSHDVQHMEYFLLDIVRLLLNEIRSILPIKDKLSDLFHTAKVIENAGYTL